MESLLSDIHAGSYSKDYDASCKKILSNKEILGWILSSCVDEYKGIDFKEIADKYIEGVETELVGVLPDQTNLPERINGLPNDDASVNEQTIRYDIRFYALAPTPNGNERIKLIINVEAQAKYNTTYPLTKRALYYCCRMISSQYGVEFKKSHYENIKKVYSIWICANPPQKIQNTINRYHITEENFVGDVKEKVKNYDLMCAIMLSLGDVEKSDGILRLLNTLLLKNDSSEIERVLAEDYRISVSNELKEDIGNMCNLSEGLIEKGIEKGFEKGRLEGIIENTVASLRNLMESMSISFEQATQLLKVSEKDIDMYKKLVEKK